MVDANDNVWDGAVQQMFSDTVMHQVLLELHSDLPATSTFVVTFRTRQLMTFLLHHRSNCRAAVVFLLAKDQAQNTVVCGKMSLIKTLSEFSSSHGQASLQLIDLPGPSSTATIHRIISALRPATPVRHAILASAGLDCRPAQPCSGYRI
jgi:hypothetical protein